MNKKSLITGFIGAFALVAQVSAGFLDITEGYSVMTFGDFNNYTDQTHGKIAAAGNVLLEKSFGVNVDHRNDDLSLNAIVAGGNVTLQTWGGDVWGSIYSAKDVTIREGYTVHGNVTARNVEIAGYNVNGAINYTGNLSKPSYVNSASTKISALPVSPVDFAAKQAAALEYSSQLASFGSNNYTFESGTLYFKDDPSNDGINFINVDVADLIKATSVHFDNLDELFVLNVNGNGGDIVLNKIDQQNYNGGEDFDFSNVLFNFFNTKTLKIGSFYGNILAAATDVTADDGMMKGFFVANSFKGHYQFHDNPPKDFTPPKDVPESSTVTMMIAGAFVLLLVSRKKVALIRK